jgi:hypothetical protein
VKNNFSRDPDILLFKPESKWTISQRERAEILFIEYPLIEYPLIEKAYHLSLKAYHLSLYFRSIFEKKILPQEAAKEF